MPPPPTALHTPSLHDALPILFARPSRLKALITADSIRYAVDSLGQDRDAVVYLRRARASSMVFDCHGPQRESDRKSTRLNSSHLVISYAVFCLIQKNKN